MLKVMEKFKELRNSEYILSFSPAKEKYSKLYTLRTRLHSRIRMDFGMTCTWLQISAIPLRLRGNHIPF